MCNNEGLSPATQQPKLSFSELPRELRDAIYHQLWLQTPRFYFRGVCQDSLCYNPNTPGLQRGLPCWLFTSRSVFQEGLQQLYRRASWTCRGDCNLKITKMLPVLVVDGITQFTLIVSTYLDTFQQHNQSGYVVTPTQDLGALLSRFGPRLKHFGLRFRHLIANGDRNAQDENWILDLSCLNNVGTRLETFSVHCEAHQLGNLTMETLAPALPSAYETETRRIGAQLVGKDFVLEVSKNTVESAFYGSTRPATMLTVLINCHKKSV